MLKFYLFDIISTYSRTYFDSLGIGYIKSYLEADLYIKKNVDIRVLQRNIFRRLVNDKPQIVGFSSTTQDYTRAVKFARKIRKCLPNSLFIIGGIHISLLPESFSSIFDVGVSGEGEKTTKELIKNVIDGKSYSHIKGIIYLNNKGKLIENPERDFINDLDSIPYPYTPKNRVYSQILTSRGCPYNCNYCSSSKLWHHRIRYHSAEYVINNIKLLAINKGAKHISIWDDIFAINKNRLRKMVRLFQKDNFLKNRITFGVMTRPDAIDTEIVELFKNMNVIRVHLGIESGSQRILDKLNRDINIKRIEYSLKLLKKNFIVSGGFFLGSPEEKIRDMRKTYNFVKNSDLNGGKVTLAVPFPGTQFWEYAEGKRLVDSNMDFFKMRLLYNFNNLENKNYIKLNPYVTLQQLKNYTLSVQRYLSKKNLSTYMSFRLLNFRNLLIFIRCPLVIFSIFLSSVKGILKS